MGPVGRLVSGGRTAVWTIAALLIGPPFLLGLFLVVGLVTDTTIEIDVALILLAVAGVVLATGVVHFARHMMRPKATINVGYEMKLIQPVLPLGRYTFRLKVHYEIEERGVRYAVQQESIEVKFRDRDHPDVLKWCTSQVESHLERHREAAQELHPHSRVVVSPPPRPAELEPAPPDRAGAG